MLSEKDYYFQLASRLKLEMAALNMTPSELAKESGVTEANLSKIIDCNARPNSYTVYKLMETISKIKGMRRVQKQEARN